MEKAKDKSELF